MTRWREQHHPRWRECRGTLSPRCRTALGESIVRALRGLQGMLRYRLCALGEKWMRLFAGTFLPLPWGFEDRESLVAVDNRPGRMAAWRGDDSTPSRQRVCSRGPLGVYAGLVRRRLTPCRRGLAGTWGGLGTTLGLAGVKKLLELGYW